jgi:hypothetical protein
VILLYDVLKLAFAPFVVMCEPAKVYFLNEVRTDILDAIEGGPPVAVLAGGWCR